MSRLAIACASLRRWSLLSGILAVFPITAAAGDPPNRDFEACSRIAEEAARLACYDAVFNAQSEREQAAVVPVPPPSAEKPSSLQGDEDGKVSPSATAHDRRAEEHAPLNEEVGLSQVERGSGTKQKSFRAEVTGCSLVASGKYYFYLDNGQVWRQTDGGRQKFEDCAFSATIERDMFGFKMSPDTEARPVRIRRVK